VIGIERDGAEQPGKPAAKCMSMSILGSRPSPGPVRTAAADTSGPAPPTIIVRPMAVAPALVPAITRPSAEFSRSRRMSLIREPTSARSRDWSPPLTKTPLASWTILAASSPSASDRPRSRRPMVWSAPSLRNTRS
jgi:hypothetical protein